MTLFTQAATALRYDGTEHRYWWDGRELVSNTTALKLAGYIDDRNYTEFARQRGTFVHQTVEFFDRGELDDDTLHPTLRPYLDGYCKFLREAGISGWTHIEQQLGDPSRGVAGTLDRLGDFGLVDIKSGDKEPWHAVQIAGYALLAEANGLIASARRVKRFGLYLHADGTYALQPYADKADFDNFAAAVTVAHWRLAHGCAA